MSSSFAIVVSEFNSEITEKLLEGALSQFADFNISSEYIVVKKVPGTVEIPLLAKILAKTQKYRAIIALGAVIRGETDHYDYVCLMVSQGCLQVMLEYETPVIFGVLTTKNEAQAWDRVGGLHGHKGKEAVRAALKMQTVLKEIY